MMETAHCQINAAAKNSNVITWQRAPCHKSQSNTHPKAADLKLCIDTFYIPVDKCTSTGHKREENIALAGYWIMAFNSARWQNRIEALLDRTCALFSISITHEVYSTFPGSIILHISWRTGKICSQFSCTEKWNSLNTLPLWCAQR